MDARTKGYSSWPAAGLPQLLVPHSRTQTRKLLQFVLKLPQHPEMLQPHLEPRARFTAGSLQEQHRDTGPNPFPVLLCLVSMVSVPTLGVVVPSVAAWTGKTQHIPHKANGPGDVNSA